MTEEILSRGRGPLTETPGVIRAKVLKELKAAFKEEDEYCDQVVWHFSQIMAVINKYEKSSGSPSGAEPLDKTKQKRLI
jgi:hypothetical protein